MVSKNEVSLSRRGFLRGQFKSAPPPPRPPWALAESRFIGACTRCGECAKVCPTRIIVVVDGYPQVDFSLGACNFCGECALVCTSGAISRANVAQIPWQRHAKVAETCLAQRQVECRVCGEHCDESAIRFSPRIGGPPLPEVMATKCSGCGACVAPCPAAAISLV